MCCVLLCCLVLLSLSYSDFSYSTAPIVIYIPVAQKSSPLLYADTIIFILLLVGLWSY